MRMFVAVWPDEATRHSLSTLDVGASGELRPVKPSQWHVTLRFLGEVDKDAVPGLAGNLKAAAGMVPGPVGCRLGPATDWFGGHRVLQIPAHGLDGLAAAVHAATVAAVPGTEPAFNGHLTLVRPRGRRLSASVRQSVTGLPIHALFDVGHFDLVGSEPTPHGHIYTTLARLELPPLP
jgi:2'-5' RNA ligase